MACAADVRIDGTALDELCCWPATFDPCAAVAEIEGALAGPPPPAAEHAVARMRALRERCLAARSSLEQLIPLYHGSLLLALRADATPEVAVCVSYVTNHMLSTRVRPARGGALEPLSSDARHAALEVASLAMLFFAAHSPSAVDLARIYWMIPEDAMQDEHVARARRMIAMLSIGNTPAFVRLADAASLLQKLLIARAAPQLRKLQLQSLRSAVYSIPRRVLCSLLMLRDVTRLEVVCAEAGCTLHPSDASPDNAVLRVRAA